MGLLDIAQGAVNVGSMGVLNPGGNGPLGNLGLDALTGGAYSNVQSTQQTNAMQMELADKQMGFQERMSSSAYQRAVEDMRKAGLNPALAYQNGGASTPSGAQAQLTAPQKGAIGAGLFNSAKDIATGIPQIQKANSETNLNNASADMQAANEQKLGANAKESASMVEVNNQMARKQKAEAEKSEMDRDIQRSRYEIDKKAAPLDAIGSRIGAIAGTVTNALKAVPKLNLNVGNNNTGSPDPVTDYNGWLKNYKQSKGK